MCLPQLNDGISASVILTDIPSMSVDFADFIIFRIIIYDLAVIRNEIMAPTMNMMPIKGTFRPCSALSLPETTAPSSIIGSDS